MSNSRYIPRVLDAVLKELLQSAGGVVLEGPRSCGKTESARQMASSEILLDTDLNAEELISINPSLLLDGPVPRLLDEWQIYPQLWNYVRREIDDRKSPGQFILTGSSVPELEFSRHSGAGRIVRLKMRPFSLFESRESTGEISLKEVVLNHNLQACKSDGNLVDLLNVISRGGWPALVAIKNRDSSAVLRGYIDEISRTDLSRAGDREFRPELVMRCLRSLARNTATAAEITTIAADSGSEGLPIDRNTISIYLETLHRIMVAEDLEAWSPSIRSRTRLRTKPKRHFVCPSLAVAALGITPEHLFNDLKYAGFLFESLVVRDLRVYADAMDARVYHYQDDSGLEVDAVVEKRSGEWAAFEIKLGAGMVDEAALNLLKFRKRVENGEIGFLGVIIPWGYSYERADGIAVIALNSLGP